MRHANPRLEALRRQAANDNGPIAAARLIRPRLRDRLTRISPAWVGRLRGFGHGILVRARLAFAGGRPAGAAPVRRAVNRPSNIVWFPAR